MPTRNTHISCAVGVWNRLTAGAVTALRVQNTSGFTIHLQATSGAAAPTNSDGSLALEHMGTLAADRTVASLWPGVAGADNIWAFVYSPCLLSVSHA